MSIHSLHITKGICKGNQRAHQLQRTDMFQHWRLCRLLLAALVATFSCCICIKAMFR